jgi:hypothetical protein
MGARGAGPWQSNFYGPLRRFIITESVHVNHSRTPARGRNTAIVQALKHCESALHLIKILFYC